MKPRPRPFRIVAQWQLIVTAAFTLIATLLWGIDGAVSAALGGAINVVAGWVYGWRVSRGESLKNLEAFAHLIDEDDTDADD